MIKYYLVKLVYIKQIIVFIDQNHLLLKALTVRKALILLVSAVFVPCVYLQAHHVKITQIQPETNPNHSNTSPRDKPLN